MITKTFETDQEAQLLLKSILPSNWLFRKQDPDIYLDYFIEIVSDTLPTGLNFAVQLKGTRQLRIKKGHIEFSFKTKHLAYYLDKVRVPVYLIIGDVIEKKCYWLFLQKYIKKSIQSKDWRKNNKIILKIPVENYLNNINEFKKVIERDEKYIRDLFPSSIPAAIHEQTNKWKILDSRIDVDIYHSRNLTTYKLKPKENMDFKFRVKKENNPDLQDRIKNAYEKGDSIEINSNDIEVEGSNLFSELIEQTNGGKLTFRPILQHKGSVIFETINESNQTTSFLYGINGNLLIRKTDFSFEGEIEDAPFGVKISAPFNRQGENLFTNIKNIDIMFKFEKWINKPVALLPFLKRLVNLFSDVNDGYKLNIYIDHEGNNLIQSSKIFTNSKSIEQIFLTLQKIYQASRIAIFLKSNILFPDFQQISSDDWETIDILYQIIFKGEYRRNAENAKWEIPIIPNFEEIEQIKNCFKTEGIFSLTIEQDISLFGQKLMSGIFKFTITNIELITDLTSINIDEIKGNEDFMNFEFKGGKNSEFVIINDNDWS